MGRQRAPDYKPLAEAQRYAAELQSQAMKEAIEEWKAFNKQQRADFEPYRQHGLKILDEIATGMESGRWDIEEWDPSSVDLEADQGYQFRLSEGLKAVRRAGAAGSCLLYTSPSPRDS